MLCLQQAALGERRKSEWKTQRKGFYTRAGLHVTIERGKGSGHTVRKVVKQQNALGLGELAAVTLAFKKNHPRRPGIAKSQGI